MVAVDVAHTFNNHAVFDWRVLFDDLAYGDTNRLLVDHLLVVLVKDGLGKTHDFCSATQLPACDNYE